MYTLYSNTALRRQTATTEPVFGSRAITVYQNKAVFDFVGIVPNNDQFDIVLFRLAMNADIGQLCSNFCKLIWSSFYLSIV